MTDIPPPDAATLRRAVIASVIGNGLEWFDFLIYGFFAAVIAEVFFPARDPELSLILTFATFGVGFVVRPLGGVLIGIYADHAGRQKALSMLIAVMAVGTVMLGITPSYAAIGLAAPILVVAARVLQGLSVGGEFASSTALLVEYAPPGRRHYFGAFQMVAQSFAVALAAGMGFVLTTCLSPQALAAWGWSGRSGSISAGASPMPRNSSKRAGRRKRGPSARRSRSCSPITVVRCSAPSAPSCAAPPRPISGTPICRSMSCARCICRSPRLWPASRFAG